MDTMIQIAESIKAKINKILPEEMPPGITGQIMNIIDIELTADKNTNYCARCRLIELDFEENWVKFEVPQPVIDKGFHSGSVLINFSGVQE